MCVFQYDSLLQLTTAQTADEINTILDDPKFMAVISLRWGLGVRLLLLCTHVHVYTADIQHMHVEYVL